MKKPVTALADFPRRVFVQREAWDYPLTERILERLGPRFEIIDNPEVIREELASFRDPIAAGKKILYLATQKGKFVKACPCSSRVISCGYFVINSVLGCPLDCSYCVLQAYLSDPWITVFVNEADLELSLKPFLLSAKLSGFRVGTGELADSLALEPLTGQAARLSFLFQHSRQAILELKTKTVFIEPWLDLPPCPQIVFSWSLNAESIAQEEEKGAAPVVDRIRAASQLAQRGYGVGFHFDPLIYFENWEKEYESVIRRIFSSLPAQSIRWISLGALRFPVAFRPIIRARFPHKPIFAGELVLGRDGKWRYFKPLRLKIFSTILEMIRSYGGENIPLYLCMEDEEVWQLVLKKKPEGKKDFRTLFVLPVN